MSNETDREMLEWAAKAAGLETEKFFGAFHDGSGRCWLQIKKGHEWHPWNPLTDDGDALRLAVKLNLAVDIARESGACWAGCGNGEAYERCEPDGDWEASTRRAICRAAAEIGRAME